MLMIKYSDRVGYHYFKKMDKGIINGFTIMFAEEIDVHKIYC